MYGARLTSASSLPFKSNAIVSPSPGRCSCSYLSSFSTHRFLDAGDHHLFLLLRALEAGDDVNEDSGVVGVVDNETSEAK